jgi:hypothetical protein
VWFACDLVGVWVGVHWLIWRLRYCCDRYPQVGIDNASVVCVSSAFLLGLRFHIQPAPPRLSSLHVLSLPECRSSFSLSFFSFHPFLSSLPLFQVTFSLASNASRFQTKDHILAFTGIATIYHLDRHVSGVQVNRMFCHHSPAPGSVSLAPYTFSTLNTLRPLLATLEAC